MPRSPNAGPRPWCRRRGTSNEGAFVPRSRSRGLGAGSLERPRPLTFLRGTLPKQRRRARSYEDLYDKVVARQGELARAQRGLRRPRAWGHGANRLARRSTERCVQLLARLASLVSERQRAYQRKMQGVPVRCNASLDGPRVGGRPVGSQYMARTLTYRAAECRLSSSFGEVNLGLEANQDGNR